MNCAATGTESECVCVCACPPAVVADLFANVQDTSAMAYSVSDSDGVCFVPSFSGLQVLCVSVKLVVFVCFTTVMQQSSLSFQPVIFTSTGMIIHSWSCEDKFSMLQIIASPLGKVLLLLHVLRVSFLIWLSVCLLFFFNLPSVVNWPFVSVCP